MTTYKMPINTNGEVNIHMTRVIGIDPGTATTGWAIVEEKRKQPAAIAYGCIQTSKFDTPEQRLVEMSRDIKAILRKYKPQEAAVEDIFFFKNLKTAVAVSQSRGAILLTLSQKKILLFSYTPLQVKQALTGYGRAEKKQIQLMVKKLLKLNQLPRPDDAADALAIGICHLHSREMKLK